MKKLMVIALGAACLLLAGCSSEEKPTAGPTVGLKAQGFEWITIVPFEDGDSFITDNVNQPEPLKELPEDYGYIGNLSEDGWGMSGDEMRDAGLKGCKVYADLTLDPAERKDVYLYQPVGENGGEWAYVRYVLLVYGRTNIV